MEEMTKSLAVSKRMVYNSYLKVNANKGSAGIDKESIEMFNTDLSNNLYRIWNRMASGSYFPPRCAQCLFPRNREVNDRLGYQQSVTVLHKE